MPKLQDYELEELYCDTLNDIYGVVNVAGLEYDVAITLKQIDPTAYRVGFNDWLDTLEDCEDCEKNPSECDCEEEN